LSTNGAFVLPIANWYKLYDMRTTLCLIALCVFLTGCSHNGEPSAAQIEAAVNEALKAKNPDAAAKITSLDIQRPYIYEEFKFSCTNCVFQFKDGSRNVVPSCEGHGMVKLDARTQKWKFDRIVVASQGIGQVIYESDHVF
jgi:hypothetical protein